MPRSVWKGKHTSCDFSLFKDIYSVIPLSKYNIYLFSIFKNLAINVYSKGKNSIFIINNANLGFILGTFIFSREINVHHSQKKTKKEKLKKTRFVKRSKGFVKKKKMHNKKVLQFSWSILNK